MSAAGRALGRLSLAAVGLLVGLGLAEGGLRLTRPMGASWLLANTPALTDASLFQVDEAGRIALTPGASAPYRTLEYNTFVRVDALGLRGPGLPPRGPGERRLLAVGDSFTLAAQVAEADTFVERLAVDLSARTGAPVSVANGGVDSHGTWDELAQLQRLQAELKPDALIVTFFLGNDLWDNCEYRGPRHPQRGADRRSGDRRPTAIFDHELRRWSYLYTWLTIYLEGRSLRSDGRRLERYRDELSMYVEPVQLRRWIGCTGRALAELSRVAEAAGLPVVLGVAPTSFTIDTSRVPATFALVGLPVESVDLDAPRAALLQVMPRSFHVVDLAPALLAAQAAGPTYFTFDGHWTPAGHAAAAEAYAPVVASVLSSEPSPASPASP